LIRNIRENYQECGYNYDGEDKKVIQVYADNLLVFADTIEHLNTLVEGLIQFMEYAHMNFNPKKCIILIHNAEKILIPPLLLPDGEGEVTASRTLSLAVRVFNVSDFLGPPSPRFPKTPVKSSAVY
jgi:hypothetical protein